MATSDDTHTYTHQFRGDTAGTNHYAQLHLAGGVTANGTWLLLRGGQSGGREWLQVVAGGACE